MFLSFLKESLPMEISDYLSAHRERVENYLERVTLLNDGCPKRLTEAIRYGLLAPGKRIRPLLTLAACELCGGEAEKALPAACAVEMIHAYSLIHDDLPAMDNDDLRRGRPTCHKQFDDATAILAGDALQSLAFETLCRLESPEIVARCTKELAQAVGPCQLIGGQMMDMAAEKNGDDRKNSLASSHEILETIHQKKTGALMRVSLRLGGIVAGATETELAALDEFGYLFGLTFQITDDLLDVLGTESEVGKKLNKDAAREKWSYPAILGVEASQNEAQRNMEMALACLDRLDDGWESLPGKTLRCLVRSLVGRDR